MKKYLIVAMATVFFGTTVASAEDGSWEVRTDLQANYGTYNKSKLRDSISSTGVILSADYLDTGGFSLAANTTRIQYKFIPAISQQSYFLSGHYNAYFDALPGILTLRMDGHFINNNDQTGNTDGVRVIAPQVSFSDFDKSYYIDVGYARSMYKNQLNIDQITPTVGFGFNEQADWLQLRGYFIRASNSARAQGKSSTTAADMKWMHWFEPSNWLNLDQLRINVLAGERIYAVDGDAAAVYNLADVQQGSASLALQWKMSETMRWMMVGGQENYIDNTIKNTYSSRFIYTDISVFW